MSVRFLGRRVYLALVVVLRSSRHAGSSSGAAARDRFRRNGLQAALRYDRKALALQMLSVLERVRAK